jgi:transcriptional regulator with XRE-family HTH domain
MTTNARATPNDALRDLRNSLGLSQHDVAERINVWAAESGNRGVGVTANTVSRWERGVIIPTPLYRRALSDIFAVPVDSLGFSARRGEPSGPIMQTDAVASLQSVRDLDARVVHSQQDWCRTRRSLNRQRSVLTHVAGKIYDATQHIADTGLITDPSWLPSEPVQLRNIELTHHSGAPIPKVDGTEPESGHVRPQATLVRQYARYTHAIRDLDRPRLFENRAAWRLLDIAWGEGNGSLSFGDTSYFAGVDVNEAIAHELALVHLDEEGVPRPGHPALRDLPFRKAIGNPFDLRQRSVLPAISTLTIRKSKTGSSFVLHRRDASSVAVAGGMLQVIPSGIFQPSSVLPAAVSADFSLWRNIMREYSEELLGDPEHDGDGQPIRYDAEPFRHLDQAVAEGRLNIWCLGVALDALTLFGEILTVAVFDAEAFDEIAGDFVDINDEGSVVAEHVPFTAASIESLLRHNQMAPSGAGCIRLAWNAVDAIGAL